ncbi:procollagen-lysine,2-oxoglutarate 5-dioxygenase [Drosophila guanche]|uniref:procollagen-lysine 5-dioxygenase n=1 Tax=Drosophila guanche TaxID=7266 RepID=A0A3B0J9K2_DROGU|nr:procollagen-lysine,2-oxoglutarate 5-dioxygenase [Drosophila guanche]SPP77043.1 blast:Procollagen-lysine%2C2-oxoglutarate 5-dioxygenase 1 [Drosophila guanche]
MQKQQQRTLLLRLAALPLLFLLLASQGAHADAVAAADAAADVAAAESNLNDKVKVFTVATEPTDGYARYVRSARIYDVQVTTLGLGEQWKGGDMQNPGGGFKINLLRKAIEPLKDEQDTIVLFTDSYDVIITATIEEIVELFKKSKAKLLFSAEKYCWPDSSLTDAYPEVEGNASRFLNSGAFIGYAPQVFALLKEDIKDTDDDQLYYTKVFLDEARRAKLGMKLDTQSRLFQNLHGAKNDVKLKVDIETNQGTLQNVNFLTTPAIVHGNGLSKIELNAYGNYLAKTFNGFCTICQEYLLELDEKDLPVISLSVIVPMAVPFFDQFLEGIEKINYPKQNLHLLIYSSVELHDADIKSFVNKHGEKYASAKYTLSTDKLDERQGRQLALEQAKLRKSDYIFFIDGDAHIDDGEVLRELLKLNKQFVAPLFAKYHELWSNFWGALSEGGFYARSHDYVDIVKRDLIGMFNVPHVTSIYLVKSSAFDVLSFQHSEYDPDMAMCASLRNAGIFMFISNQRYFGHLVNADSFDTKVTRPDFYTLFSNRYDWTEKYIHPNYSAQLNATVIEQPCPDVYWMAIVTDAFCDDLVAIMEAHGTWSDGSNNDNRLEGGYEAVPTRDIHMKQVGLEVLYLKFLELFVRPLQERVFTGYYHNPPRALMNFMVRYRPDEQPSLRPHHDASTYTINIAMNQKGIDYEGGGCRFLRYNCSVTETKKGWMLMHPGRLTHYHEGLLVTKGTRYIMISFIDP